MGDTPVKNLGVANEQVFGTNNWETYCSEYPLLCSVGATGLSQGSSDSLYLDASDKVPGLPWYGLDQRQIPGLFNDTIVQENFDSTRVITPITDKDEPVWLGTVYEKNDPIFPSNLPLERPYQKLEGGVFFKAGENGYVGFTAGLEQGFVQHGNNFDAQLTPTYGVSFGWTIDID